MCLICILWEKDKITAREADRALVELIETDENVDLIHVQETIERILKEENE